MSEIIQNHMGSCIHGELPLCSKFCPFQLDVRQFVDKMQRGNFRGAYRIYRDTVLFPEIVSRLCATHCMSACILEEPVDLRALEAACVRLSPDKEPTDFNLPSRNQRVAVVGAGISGLACALRISSKKYTVDVFEKNHRIGGGLWGELPETVFLEEFNRSFKYEKYQLHLHTEITDYKSLDYDAVYLATGNDCFNVMDSSAHVGLRALEDGVFAGGSMTGVSRIEALSHGIKAARAIEIWLKTQRMPDLTMNLDTVPQIHREQSGELSLETAVQAQTYAKNCRKCDCDRCFAGCEMMQDYNKYPVRIRDEVYATLNPVKLMAKRMATRLIYSCNMCGNCGDSCPKGIDMQQFLLESRRMMHREGSAPPVFHDFWLRDMKFSDEQSCVIIEPETEKTEYVFFPGCQLGASDPNYVLEAYRWARKTYNQTALLLKCCGVPAYWAGDDKLHKASIEKTRSFWENHERPVFVFACPTCKHTFEKFMPEIQGISLYEWTVGKVERMLSAGRFKKAAVFDPCASRYDEKMQKSVRELAIAGGCTLEELDNDGGGICCGFGGHTFPANPQLVKKTAIKRAEMSSLPYITYCTNCRDIFAREGKECIHILDLVFSLNMENQKLPPTISQRMKNRLELKNMLIKEWMQEEIPDMAENRIKVKIPVKLQEKLHSLLLLEDEVKQTILYCEETGRKIFQPSTGCFTGHLKLNVVTCWVVYKITEEGYELVNAYSHRLEIAEENDEG